jgi:hypothetical protein
MSETTADVKYEDKKKIIKTRSEVQENSNKPLKDALNERVK